MQMGHFDTNHQSYLVNKQLGDICEKKIDWALV